MDGLIVRIQHLAQILGDDLLVDGAVVVAAVEDLEVKRLGRLRAPQTQRVGRIDAIAQDRRVVRYAVDDPVWDPADTDRSVVVRVPLRVSAQFDFDSPLGPRHLPGVAVA